MKTPKSNLSEILWKFLENYSKKHQEINGHLPLAEFDKDWISPCQQGKYDETQVFWAPVRPTEDLQFDNVETALELVLHSDIKTYFTTFYGDSVHAKSKDGNLSLLLPWNYDDFQRLQENIIGHILMKTKLKQGLTVFFAVTDQDDHILSIVNETGEIWVEKVGCEPHKKVANSLAEFICELSSYIPPQE